MQKVLKKILYLSGDITYVGIATTIIWYGVKLSKWAFNEFETDLRD